MESFLHSVSSVAIILLLTAAGYFCAARHWMNADSKAFISKFVMAMALPCMTARSFSINLTRERILDSVHLLLIPITCMALNYVISYALGRLMKITARRMGVFMMMCSMSNTIFVGYAMCTELFGEAAVPYIMLFYLVSTCYTQLIGIPLVRRFSTPDGAPKVHFLSMFIKTPAILAIFLGISMVMCGWNFPPLIDSFCRYMSNVVTPLALLMTGYIIYDIGLSNLRIEPAMWVVLGFRFFFSPLMFLLMCHLLGVTGLPMKVFLIEAAMPVITLSVVAAVEYGGDDEFAAQGSAISTLASFLVIPVYMFFL